MASIINSVYCSQSGSSPMKKQHLHPNSRICDLPASKQAEEDLGARVIKRHTEGSEVFGRDRSPDTLAVTVSASPTSDFSIGV